MPEKFLKVRDIADTLQVHRTTVMGWIEQGLLPATRIGKTVRVSESDFNRFIAEFKHAGNQKAGADSTGSEEERLTPALAVA